MMINVSDWNEHGGKYFSELWPGWDRTIRLTGANIDYPTSVHWEADGTKVVSKGINDIGMHISMCVSCTQSQSSTKITEYCV